ncbi:MAG: ferritin-like domain-containing protein [Myxococcales bacterium]|nr:ferritin-like domain-containing protein [Myxococcales bacterium]
MTVLDLKQYSRKVKLTLPDNLALTDEQRQLAISEWHGRMLNEHISARVFAALIPQMMRAEIEPELQARVADSCRQELRHGQLCAAVVEALGGSAIAELPELDDVPLHRDVSPLEGVVRNIIAVSCLNETVAVALLSCGRERVGPPALEAIVTEILRDEVQHARLGWGLLEAIAPRLTRDERQRLSDYLVPALRQLFDRHFLRPEATYDRAPHGQSTAEVGVDDPREASELFLDTVHDVIVPGLTAHGLDAQGALRRALAA